MIDRYSVSHRVNPFIFVKSRILWSLKNIHNPWVRVQQEHFPFCVIAGCGHSGTSLLASRLGAHKAAFLVPRESGVFLPKHGLATAGEVTESWFDIASANDRQLVIEKTPKHVQCVARILRLCKNAKVILCTRNPLDNCASLYERFGEIDYAIERWMIDNEQVLRWGNHEAVRVVKYEDLTVKAQATIGSLVEFVGLPPDENLHQRVAEGLYAASRERNQVLRREQVGRKIRARGRRWMSRLNERQADIVQRRTADMAEALGYDIEYQR